MGKIWPKRSLGTLNNACPRDTTNTPRLKALERLLQQQDTNSGYLYTRTLFDPPPQPPKAILLIGPHHDGRLLCRYRKESFAL